MKINKVTLYTSDLERMDDFYCGELGFKRLFKNCAILEILIGQSILAFELAPSNDKHQYHFAFNIPGNLFKDAKAWTEQHVPLLTSDGADEIYFENIDAHSLYFYDPDENVVELIARHSVNPHVYVGEFTTDTILGIGEINLTTDDLIKVGEQLNTHGIPVRNNEQLHASSLNFMGDSNGAAFILLGPSKRNWYFSTKVAVVSTIKIVVNDQFQLLIDEAGLFNIRKLV